MARIWRICFRVRGRVITRTSTVNAMMAMPMLLKKMTYNTIKVLSMGRIMTSFQRRIIMSTKRLS
jgi:hypothetical protein